MRTKTEIQLMTLRQRYFDAMAELRSAKTVDLRAFKFAFVMFKVCDFVLLDYRLNEKCRDVA